MKKDKTIDEQVEVFVSNSGKKLKVLIFEKSTEGGMGRFTMMNANRELVTYQGVPVETPDELVKILKKNGLLDQIIDRKKEQD